MIKNILFVIILVFQFEILAQSPENYIPNEDGLPPSTNGNLPPNVSPINENTTKQDSVQQLNLPQPAEQAPTVTTVDQPTPQPPQLVTPEAEPTQLSTIEVKEPTLKRSIAVASDVNPIIQCPAFIEGFDKCINEKCHQEKCNINECQFSKILNQELHTFIIKFQKNSKNGKCNLKHEIKNAKDLPIENYDCQFNNLQMRQAKVFYSRFLASDEFTIERPICIEPTAEGGRKIASTCEITFDDGLKLINIFELGKKHNQCL